MSSWHHQRLNEMCARVQAEAASKAARILRDMEVRDGEPYSRWEFSRVVFPRIMADLEALGKP